MTQYTGHDRHDRLLVARRASGDLAGTELKTADALVAACADCAALERDLVAVASALQGLPAGARPRDFRLTPGDAARLRSGAWRRALAAFAGPRFELARPVGAALTSLGLAGLVFASLPGVQMAASPAPAASPAAAPGAPAASDAVRLQSLGAAQGGATEVQPGGYRGPVGIGATASPDEAEHRPYDNTGAGRDLAGGSDMDREVGAEPPVAPSSPTTNATVALLSGVLMIAGLGLFGLRWTARRLGDG